MIKNQQELTDLSRDFAAEIIGQYVHLKRQGNSLVGLCPFHSEKTPSFRVNTDKGYYKCFGCGQGGDPIHFLMEHEKLTFPEALERVGKIAKMKVEYTGGADRDEYLAAERQKADRKQAQQAHLENIFNIYYYNRLPYTEINFTSTRETRVLQYFIQVDNRQYLPETIQNFKICYAPAGGMIASLIDSEKLDRAILHEVGIIKSGDHGDYDFFRDRLLFPIHNHHGQLVGFAGRKPADNIDPKNPKYINSPESFLYRKDELLYGLHLARPHLNDQKEATLVEGYTDVMTLHEFGLKSAVASCGTSFTQGMAKLISRFTKKVLILRDGDEAGLKAARRDVETCLEAGLHPKVCILPDKQDPDSYMRLQGPELFRQYLADHTEDGLIWLVMDGWDPEDPFKREDGILQAARLISYIDGDIARDDYINRLTKPDKLGKASAKSIKLAIDKQDDEKIRKGDRKLSPAQEFDALHFGIYEDRNKYWLKTESGGMEISNFVVKPIMLIRARDEARRLIQIINENGQTFISDLDAKILADFNRFSQFVEGMGDFLYNEWAKPQHHIRIKRKLYAMTPTCFPIYTMGWHKEGFWTWGNGITTTDGKFHPVNEFGIVTHGDTKYFLKAHSQIDLSIKSDDDENSMEDQINFAYMNTGKTPSLYEITDMLIRIHGDNAMVAFSWYMTSLFRDIIYPSFNFFPHLNHFGPPGTGKSFLAWSIMYFFSGKPKSPYHLVHGTDAAFFRTLSWVRNGAAWFDEYKNEVDYRRIEALKAAYDGAGHEKAKGAYGNVVTRTQVNSGCIITGQEQPVQDPALFSRCISLSFPTRELTPEQIELADKLKDIQTSGVLTQITSYLIQFREVVAEKFQQEFDYIRGLFRKQMQTDDIDVNDRVIQNYSIVIAITTIISAKDKLAYSIDQLIEFAYSNMTTQLESMGTQDEVGTFWKIIDYLLASKIIRHEADIIVEESVAVKVMKENKTERARDRKDSEEITFEKETKLLYINFTRAHPEYMDRMGRQKRSNVLDIEALKYYLRCNDAYIGEKKGKKFAGQSKPCYVFYADRLPVEFPLTVVAVGQDGG